jgi:protein Mpv17
MQSRSPLTTQLESSLIIYFLGDLCAQTMQTDLYTTGRYEPIRALRAMVIGGLSSIPSYKWFLFLGRHFNYASSHIKSLAVKITVNQMCFTPVFNTYFFGMQTLLAGGSFAEAKERVINTVPRSFVSSWKVWPIITAFSFTFVRPQNRSVFAGVFAVFWQTYLSWLNRTAEAKEREERRVQFQAVKTVEAGGRREAVEQKEEPKQQKKKVKRKKKVEKEEERA